MNSSTIGILKMLMLDLRKSMYVIFSILLVIYATFTTISMLAEGGEVTLAGLSPLHVYAFVIGIVAFKETLPYALGMNVRRIDYYKGYMLTGLIIAVVCALAISLLSLIENAMFTHFGSQVKMFRMNGSDSLGHFGGWVANFILLLVEFVLGFVFALLYKRFGATGLYIFFGACVLAGALFHLFGIWGPIFGWLGALTVLDAVLWLLPLLGLNIVVTYLLMRRVTV